MIFLIALLLILNVQGLMLNKNINFNKQTDPIIQVFEFGFHQGGTFNLTIVLENLPTISPLTFYVCTHSQFSYLRHSSNPLTQSSTLPCYLPAFERCSRKITLEKTTNISGVAEESIYHFLIADCDLTPLSIAITASLVNPGSFPQLSTTVEFLPTIYSSFLGVWFLPLVAMIINRVMHPNYKLVLHRLIFGSILIKQLVLVVQIIFWNIIGEIVFLP